MNKVNFITLLDLMSEDIDCLKCPVAIENCHGAYVCCADKMYEALKNKGIIKEI